MVKSNDHHITQKALHNYFRKHFFFLDHPFPPFFIKIFLKSPYFSLLFSSAKLKQKSSVLVLVLHFPINLSLQTKIFSVNINRFLCSELTDFSDFF